MKIVVLDGHTLNPGDISWDAFDGLGDMTIHGNTGSDKILERAQGADVLLTNKTPLTKETINHLPALKYIGVLATGYNVVDTHAAAERNIPVTNIPEYGTTSVCQMVFAHILNLCNGVDLHSRSVREGEWARSEHFCYWKKEQIELAGKTLGVVGLGRIGRSVAVVAQAFGMNVMAYDPVMSDAPEGIKLAEIAEVFTKSDFVTLHCPLTDSNKGFVNASLLKRMKPSAFLINTSRGQLIHEQDLAEALKNRTIAGAGLDVLTQEPPKPDNPLLKLDTCFITPHIAWATRAARIRLMQTAADNLKAYLRGQRTNTVN